MIKTYHKPVNPRINPARKSAFTLIELLVVIAIIAILAAILFPVFGRARENARRSSCQSNLKQISLGLMQYNQDYDERMPAGVGQGSVQYYLPGNVPATWDLLIQPYIKSTQVLTCPSDTGSIEFTLPNYGRVKRSYAMAGYMWNVTGNFWEPQAQGQSLAAIASPSLTLMVIEGGASPTWVSRTNPNPGDYWWNDRVFDTGATGSSDGRKALRDAAAGAKGIHLDTNVFAYADGHVKALRLVKGGSPPFTGHTDCYYNDGYNEGCQIWDQGKLPK